MSRLTRRHRLVAQDIIQQAEHIEKDSFDAALRFFDNVERTFEGLAHMPGKGALREFDNTRFKDLRSWPVDGFPNHLVFYLPAAYGIYVLAVLHGARDLLAALEGRS